jgi:hypothetical protein
MRSPEHKINAAMQSYAKKWMKSIDQPRIFTSPGYFFVGLFILFWSSSITVLLDFDIKNGYGTVIFIVIGLSLTLVTIYINKIMSKIGLERPLRSALMLSALVGPYVNLIVYNSFNLPVISHIAGFLASVLTFIFSYLFDTSMGRRFNKSD